MGKNFSNMIVMNTGTPQGCVLSPTLYNLFTHDCASSDDTVDMAKFADDTTLCGHVTDDDDTRYRAQVHDVTEWCHRNNLHLNVNKTKEIVIDFKTHKSPIDPLIINGSEVERVDTFKFLGVNISNNLKWENHIVNNLKGAQQKMYFLRLLKSFNVSSYILVNFYRSSIESILSNAILVWYKSATKKDIDKLNRVVKNASYVIGSSMRKLDTIYEERVKSRTEKIMSDDTHPSHHLFELLPSGRRLRSYGGTRSTDRFLNSFYPCATRLYNDS